MRRETPTTATPAASVPTDARFEVRAFYLIALLFCGLLLGWGFLARLDAGAIAEGEVIPAGRVRTDIARFAFFSSIMGAVLAFIIFTVSAFSIPLIYDGRATLVSGVAASARAVFARFPVVMSWALAMSAAIIVSALLLPLLVVSLPVAAYTGRALYRRLFPA